MLIATLSFTSQAMAWDSITILTSNNAPATNELIEQLQQDLSKTVKSQINVSLTSPNDTLPVVPADALVVAVGVQAFLQASTLDSRNPVVGVLVPKSSYDKIVGSSNRPQKSFSGIYIDHPISRQITLIKNLFPSANTLGILLGPSTSQMEQDITRAGRAQGLSVVSNLVDSPDDLIPQLKKTLANSHLMLAIADPLIYNKETAQTILLTSYRHQKPVIGFSQAYVKAGAVAAIVTSPSQFGRQTAELINRLRNRNELPPPAYPQYLSVEINRQVARSLGVEPIDENLLTEKLMRAERSSE